jgi:hypothetical protein
MTKKHKHKVILGRTNCKSTKPEMREKLANKRSVKEEDDPRRQPEYSHRPSDFHDPETLRRSWRHT